ncbi:hypothetical protein D3C71_1394400 [compost metagenome]
MRVDTLNELLLPLEHGLWITRTVVVDADHQLLALFLDADQQRMPGIAGGVGQHVGDDRGDQFAVEETQRVVGVDAPGREDVIVLERFLVGGQLGFDEVVQLVVVRAHRQLVDAQLVQAQQLHQHAVEVAELVLHHPLLGASAQLLGQTRQPLAMGLDQR